MLFVGSLFLFLPRGQAVQVGEFCSEKINEKRRRPK